jgi:endogenous inhibitor of DNA gyrase (YacG/DUF329 family)
MKNYNIDCLNCGDPVENARTDQKFCSLTCKNCHNNRKLKELYHLTKMPNKETQKNMLILKNLTEQDILEVEQNRLGELGYNWQYNSEIVYDSKINKRIYFCFDYGVMRIEGNKFKIIKK